MSLFLLALGILVAGGFAALFTSRHSATALLLGSGRPLGPSLALALHVILRRA